MEPVSLVNISVQTHTSDGKRCVCTVSLCDVFDKMGQNSNEKRDPGIITSVLYQVQEGPHQPYEVEEAQKPGE